MANNLTTEQLFQHWQNQFVPRSFNAGFVTLSYIVSLIGAASTLELINRRTAPKGTFNQSVSRFFCFRLPPSIVLMRDCQSLLLVSAAITMGGIAIWCMHYIGNRAIDLANGEIQLQIAYSSGFTALSFFVPIIVLLGAFVAIGTSSTVSWWRVAVGGTLAGAAICGMHYLGNASINNYVCIYNAANVVGAALIAVAASILALSLFFVFRAAWTNSWWKRGCSAILLAGAVSGMHWCASTGTKYKLVAINEQTDNQLSRNTTVIVVICLSIGACTVMAGTATYTAHIRKRYAHKAQQVVLSAAVFDKHGRVLVSPDGLLPSEKITDSFLEKTPQDSFSVAHPLFHWMFQASRNWSSITSIIGGITNHLSHLPHNGRDNSRGGIELITDHGELIENYDIIFRELFCAAATGLADKMKTQLTNVGILWDEILPTGAGGHYFLKRQRDMERMLEADNLGSSRMNVTLAENIAAGMNSNEDLAEKGAYPPHQPYHQQEFGRGSLMFLVRRVENVRDMEALEAAGYRFAELHQVSGIIGSTMQIKTRSIESKLRSMAAYAEQNTMLEPGVHVGFFGVRARVNSYGFDVLARKEARNLLPSVQMPLTRLEPWQLDFLAQFDRMTPLYMARRLESTTKSMSPQEQMFALQLTDRIEALRNSVEDIIVDEAMLCPEPVEVPCRPASPGSTPGTCTVIAFRAVVPIHLNIASPKCEFVPLNFFKVHQLVYKDSPTHLAFSRSVHRELAPILNSVPVAVPLTKPSASRNSHARHASLREARMTSRLFHKFGRPQTSSGAVDEDGNPIPTVMMARSGSTAATSNMSSLTLKMWPGPAGEASPSISMHHLPREPYHEMQPPHGGSMTSFQAYGNGNGHEMPMSPLSALSPRLSTSSAQQQQQTQHQTSSFGGIMVSQEVTVNVHRTDDMSGDNGSPQRISAPHGRKDHGRPTLLRRGPSEGSGDASGSSGGGPGMGSIPAGMPMGAPTGSEAGLGIEMRNMGAADRSRNNSMHIGAGLHVFNVEAERLTDVPTFVDDLFSFCVEGR